MSTLRTTNSSHLSEKESTISAYSVYKKLTQGNKTLERTLHPSNLLITHYKPYDHPNKKMNRTAWLEAGHSGNKEIEGNMFSRKNKPDQVSFILEMKYDLLKQSKMLKYRYKTSLHSHINSNRTINPEYDNDNNVTNRSSGKGKKHFTFRNKENKVKNLMNNSALLLQSPMPATNKGKKTFSLASSLLSPDPSKNKGKKTFLVASALLSPEPSKTKGKKTFSIASGSLSPIERKKEVTNYLITSNMSLVSPSPMFDKKKEKKSFKLSSNLASVSQSPMIYKINGKKNFPLSTNFVNNKSKK